MEIAGSEGRVVAGLKLKPCPFCGGKAELTRIMHGYSEKPTAIRDTWKVSCGSCFARTKEWQSYVYSADDGELVILCDGAKEAAEAWNQRADDRFADVRKTTGDNNNHSADVRKMVGDNDNHFAGAGKMVVDN